MNTETNSSHRLARTGPWVAAAALAVLATALWWYWPAPAPPRKPDATGGIPTSGSLPPKPKPVSEAFVGSQSCGSCHSEIAEQYVHHPMSYSFATIAEAAPLEDYSPERGFEKGGCRYWVELADDGVYHHESYSDSEGTLYDQRFEVQYALGSGQRGRSYFIDRGGLMFVSPISWYSFEKRWDLSPSYPERNHLRFERPVSGRCLGCHAGRIQTEPGQNDRFLHPAVREFAISCERCHGPGRDHVAWHRGRAETEGTDPIINPAKLSPSRRDAVCNQCHLQGADEVRRYGRGDFDFRPGMEIGDVWTIFVEGTGVETSGETAAVSQVQQMYASRCYMGSSGQLGCITCHDSHHVPPPAERESSYNQKCASCHDTRGCSLAQPQRLAVSPTDSCIHCHMPRLGANNVPHTTQTDHRILRVSGSASADLQEDESPAARIFDLEFVPLEEFDLNRALGIHAANLAEGMNSAEQARKAIEQLKPVYQRDTGDVAVADAYGLCLALTGELQQAIDVWRRALGSDTKHEGLLFSLGMAHFNRGEHHEALQYLDRLTAVNPWRSDYQGQRARVLMATGRLKEAIDIGMVAAELNPSLPLVYEWLAYACDQDKRPAEAERYRRLQQRAMRR